MKRRISTWTTTSTMVQPEAFVTKGKQRLKQHDGNVYLKDKQEFEIELFNPTTTHQLAKIKLNGNYMTGGGIVIRPGERVFLERYLDSNNKFQFTTYDVGSSKSVEIAIQNNGSVEVEFYQEYFKPIYPQWQTSNVWYSDSTPNTTFPPTHDLNFFDSGITNNTNFGTISTNTSTMDSLSIDDNTLSSSRGIRSRKGTKCKSKSKTKETGIVGKGETSDQKFTYSNIEFQSFSSFRVLWKILPESQQIHTSDTLTKVYCTECGSRIRKSNFKFCPNCGTQI